MDAHVPLHFLLPLAIFFLPKVQIRYYRLESETGRKMVLEPLRANLIQTVLRPKPNRSLVLEPIPRYTTIPRGSPLFAIISWNRNHAGSPQNEELAPRFYCGTPRYPAPLDPVSSFILQTRPLAASRVSQLCFSRSHGQ